MNLYEQALTNGAELEFKCSGLSIEKWNELMSDARKANQQKAIRIALLAGVIDKQWARSERKNPMFNPYYHQITDTHIIYVHSGIEHFIKPL